jgi:hypothetical protein
MRTLATIFAYIGVCLFVFGLLGHLIARLALWIDDRAAKRRNQREKK